MTKCPMLEHQEGGAPGSPGPAAWHHCWSPPPGRVCAPAAGAWGWVLRRAPALWTSHKSRRERAHSCHRQARPQPGGTPARPDPLRATVGMECRGPGSAPAGHLLFTGSNSQATGKDGLRDALVQTTRRSGSSVLLRDGPGSKLLVGACTRNLGLPAPGAQHKHVSWTRRESPRLPSSL